MELDRKWSNTMQPKVGEYSKRHGRKQTMKKQEEDQRTKCKLSEALSTAKSNLN